MTAAHRCTPERPCSDPLEPHCPPQTDRAGFTRRYGVHVFHVSRAPWLSLGIHVDWHTPTLDLYIGRTCVQIGKNQWDAERRVVVARHRSDGHTDQCTDRPGRRSRVGSGHVGHFGHRCHRRWPR